MKNKTTAALLAFFLGGLGAHKFYLERILQGVLYLIFCWTFIPSIISFIEFIIYLTMSDQEFNLKYNDGKAPALSSRVGTADEIMKLNDLREKGIISDEEFHQRKSRL